MYHALLKQAISPETVTDLSKQQRGMISRPVIRYRPLTIMYQYFCVQYVINILLAYQGEMIVPSSRFGSATVTSYDRSVFYLHFLM